MSEESLSYWIYKETGKEDIIAVPKIKESIQKLKENIEQVMGETHGCLYIIDKIFGDELSK